jgi:hypothetical protein
MHLQLSMSDGSYSTDIHGLTRQAAHRLITQLGEVEVRPCAVRVRLEPETAAEERDRERGQYSDGYEVER